MISQEHYVLELLEKYELLDAKPASTAQDPNETLRKTRETINVDIVEIYIISLFNLPDS